MTPVQYLFSVYVSALGTILGTPQVEPDPALIAQLEQERPAAVGKNGADALYAIPQAPTGELTLFCNVDQADCLDAARQNLVAYRAAAQQHKKAWQVQEKAIAALRQYDHFRYPASLNSKAPPYSQISKQSIRAAYRFIEGEKKAAMQSVCTHATLGLHLINTAQNQMLDSDFGATTVIRNTALLAEMLAESPAGTRLPAACDELKEQAAENLSLCPRMYSEWHIISEVLQKDMQEGLTKMPFTDEQYRELGVNFFPNTMLTSLFNQAEAYALQEFSRSCSAENRAAVARGELPNLTPTLASGRKIAAVQRSLHRRRELGLHPLSGEPAQRQPLSHRTRLPTPSYRHPTRGLSHRKQYPDLHPLPDTQKRRRDANRHPAAARQPV